MFYGADKAVIQSKEKLTLSRFAHDLRSIGVRDALYTPIGDGDGGWYRDAGKIISIGTVSSPTPVQSNWVVWKKAPAKSDRVAADKWLRKHLKVGDNDSASSPSVHKVLKLQGKSFSPIK